MLKTFRFATFNAALNRNQGGLLISDLSTPNNQQAQNVAEIIQRVNPDVLVLQEFDYDKDGRALQLFQNNYLRLSRNGAQSIYFSSFPRSAWECLPGRSASRTAVQTGIPTQSVGTRIRC